MTSKPSVHVIQYSGGIGSWCTAQRVAAQHGVDDLVLLFADTRIEEPSLYEFLAASAAQLGVPLVRVADGRTPFEVYWDSRFLGNARIAPCSKILKQVPARRWLEANADPDTTTLYVGVDATEAHRIPGIRRGWAPWRVEFPLTAEPGLTKDAMLAEARGLGLIPPAAYQQGFSHANCGGCCVRGGQAHWLRLLEQHPERFADYERKEEQFRAEFGDVAILKQRRNGVVRPLPLAELRQRASAAEPDAPA
ncbi:hypothetical protein CFP71_10080 [Amycolatopsis thailandensis]|uniref:Phosphoadenosine phosphosulphate reductase domain-containing protein n=1 Tax=Amycolatopsis thailandensis TaxID=589330 RepID=A0A229SEL9_9PSEU|nr:hypothetical protein [Amycolatopsis thailandensis]OXM57074.1 hypothetical protein CFP71_10080 [Amycolatopsis thailandensis]